MGSSLPSFSFYFWAIKMILLYAFPIPLPLGSHEPYSPCKIQNLFNHDSPASVLLSEAWKQFTTWGNLNEKCFMEAHMFEPLFHCWGSFMVGLWSFRWCSLDTENRSLGSGFERLQLCFQITAQPPHPLLSMCRWDAHLLASVAMLPPPWQTLPWNHKLMQILPSGSCFGSWCLAQSQSD